MNTDSMVAKVACALLLLGLVGARPISELGWNPALNTAVTVWSPMRTALRSGPVTLVRDSDGRGWSVNDKGALFGFNAMSNTNGVCNTDSSHECYCSTFTDNSVVGRLDGAEWFIIGVTSSPVKTVGVWAGHDYVIGVQVWFFDGSTHFYGRKEGLYGELSLYASERITQMSVWENGAGRIGGISFKTSRGGFFKWGMTKRFWQDEYKKDMDVGSGLMMNIFGLIRWSSNDLYAIGFDFLRTIVAGSGVMRSITYKDIPEGQIEEHKDLILRTKYENKANFPQKFLFAGDVEVVTDRRWDVQRSIRFDNEFDVFGSAPEAFESTKDDWAWRIGQEVAQKVGSTDESRDYRLEIKVPPHKNYYAEAWLYSDTVEAHFDATIEFTLTTTATYKLQSYGSYFGKTFRKVLVNSYEYSAAKQP
ncbi:hypothetical protein BSKO_12103 [Bryopsis sp. KO-2023]|nr:hypothetical protein BSKO_12103 [Bryopsis sp. KO-2023]